MKHLRIVGMGLGQNFWTRTSVLSHSPSNHSHCCMSCDYHIVLMNERYLVPIIIPTHHYLRHIFTRQQVSRRTTA